MKLEVVSLLWLTLINTLPTALACGPAKVIGVYFDRDSAAVSTAQMSRLAD